MVAHKERPEIHFNLAIFMLKAQKDMARLNFSRWTDGGLQLFSNVGDDKVACR